MTKRSGPMSDKQRRHSQATSAAMRRSAESRRCPKCKRKAAVNRQSLRPGTSLRWCRWDDCDYEKITDSTAGLSPEVPQS